MSAMQPVRDWVRPARVRSGLDTFVIGLPAVLVLAVLAWRFGGMVAAFASGFAGLLVLVAIVWRQTRRFGQSWLVGQLDAARADIEDSADLLFADATRFGPLQHLQRARIAARLAEAPLDLRPAWSLRRIAAGWALGALAIAAILLWSTPPRAALAPSREGLAATPGRPQLVGQRLRVIPPAYTGLPARDLDTLDARAPQGSRLVWTLAFAPPPTGAQLAFVDGAAVPLAPNATTWQASIPLDRPRLYRVVPAGARQIAPLHRLDAIVDQPPEVVVRAPAHTLTLATPGQTRWPLTFEARDDYGVAPDATLRVTVAAGDGEQVTFREHLLTLHGIGPVRARRFAVSLDLNALGFTGPGDLVADLTIRDTRTPGPQTARAPSLILRRLPPRPDQASGLDGTVRAVLPAYLRSQRQVINDAEALLRQRRALPPSRFATQSLSIGGDQHALRMHYGEFLGQENEGHENALPTADAAPAPTALGREEDVLGDYGHKHDDAESATLFDPETKARLTDAVGAMWQSELALNQGDPARALPFANRALTLIKQVQQATRVFLARVGTPELPPIDETRRLSGKRDDIGADPLALAAMPGDEGAAARIWAAASDAAGPAGLAEVARWVRSGAAHGGDPLALAAALDAAERAPACAECRARLRALVWPALHRPIPGVARRAAGGDAGRRYFDALGAGR